MTPINAITPRIFQKKFIVSNKSSNYYQEQPVKKQNVLDLESECFINDKFSWLTSSTLKSSLKELYSLQFDENDMRYLQSVGLNLPFTSGKDVVQYLEKENVRIGFDKIPEPDVHAHYNYEKNIICINDKYKNSQSRPVVLAIASAILHEASHAKDKDGMASIQEELECLGMNAMAHRAFIKKYTDIFKNSNIPIIQDGVSLYADLFFNYPNLNDLVLRVRTKYGYLPVGCEKHHPSELAFRVKNTKAY